MASVVEGKCGRTIFQVNITDINNISAEFDLFYKINSTEKKLLYSTGDRISIACIKDIAKNELLLIEEFCSGSVCSDDGAYTVIDPKTKKILIKADSSISGEINSKNALIKHLNNMLKLCKHEDRNEVMKEMLLIFKEKDQIQFAKRYSSEMARLYEHHNHEQVAELIGFTPPYLPDSKNSFCCTPNQY